MVTFNFHGDELAIVPRAACAGGGPTKTRGSLASTCSAAQPRWSRRRRQARTSSRAGTRRSRSRRSSSPTSVRPPTSSPTPSWAHARSSRPRRARRGPAGAARRPEPWCHTRRRPAPAPRPRVLRLDVAVEDAGRPSRPEAGGRARRAPAARASSRAAAAPGLDAPSGPVLPHRAPPSTRFSRPPRRQPPAATPGRRAWPPVRMPRR